MRPPNIEPSRLTVCCRTRYAWALKNLQAENIDYTGSQTGLSLRCSQIVKHVFLFFFVVVVVVVVFFCVTRLISVNIFG